MLVPAANVRSVAVFPVRAMVPEWLRVPPVTDQGVVAVVLAIVQVPLRLFVPAVIDTAPAAAVTDTAYPPSENVPAPRSKMAVVLRDVENASASV